MQTTFNNNNNELIWSPNEKSTKISTPKKTILKAAAVKKFAINLPTIINLNYLDVPTTSTQNHLKHFSTYSNEIGLFKSPAQNHSNNLCSFINQNNLNRKKVSPDSFTDAKIGDYRISVKNMNDLKDGLWLNDNVRNKKNNFYYFKIFY